MDARRHSTGLDNNFTPLRLALALLVVVAHFKLLDVGDYTNLVFPYIYGSLAVQCFFVVSGYLITSSYDRDPNLFRFYVRRFFRIYPLYLTVITLQTGIMAALVQGGALAHAKELCKYFITNAVFANFMQRDVGGVLRDLPNHGLNASLWTLKIEVAFYAILPALWYLMRRKGLWTLAVVFVLSAVYYELVLRDGYYEYAKQLPGQLQYFVVGMAGFALRDKIRCSQRTALVLMIALAVILSLMTGYHCAVPGVYPLLVGTFVIVTALRVQPVRVSTDISFGTYLLHAPIIQMSLLLGIYRSDWIGLAITTILVSGLALGVEQCIEKPFIALGRRLTQRPSQVAVEPYGSLSSEGTVTADR